MNDMNSNKLSDSQDVVSYTADSLTIDLEKDSGTSPTEKRNVEFMAAEMTLDQASTSKKIRKKLLSIACLENEASISFVGSFEYFASKLKTYESIINQVSYLVSLIFLSMTVY
ncbi:hypothetical protein QVD17_07923 [Tagetes erecta]|uniref:Uncharacterized protein n=1 Tax=Tagetes erecta TaxID=13708 RepID=A0AAD8P405_TARER|nr:hypothetical protein QVD17_07923 [Tagetes erecta]